MNRLIARVSRVLVVMVMERLADFVSKSLEGGEAPAPPPEPGEPATDDGDDDLDVEVDITALEEQAPATKRPRNWLVSPLPVGQCKKESPHDDDDEHKHGKETKSDLIKFIFFILIIRIY